MLFRGSKALFSGTKLLFRGSKALSCGIRVLSRGIRVLSCGIHVLFRWAKAVFFGGPMQCPSMGQSCVLRWWSAVLVGLFHWVAAECFSEWLIELVVDGHNFICWLLWVELFLTEASFFSRSKELRGFLGGAVVGRVPRLPAKTLTGRKVTKHFSYNSKNAKFLLDLTIRRRRRPPPLFVPDAKNRCLTNCSVSATWSSRLVPDCQSP